MNTHQLDLNAIKGWGKGKPLLNLAFLLGLLGIGGVPGFNGYISKTLLHESIVEFAHHSGSGWITAVEWLFLISGGITLAYMTKLYVCLFVQGKKPEETGKKYMNPLSTFAIMAAALVLPVLGMLPYATQDKLAALGTPFMHAGHMAHAVHYFTWVNIKGAVISLVIAAVLYFGVVRLLLTRRQNDETVYLNRWPNWLDLEDLLYRPLLLKWLPGLFGAVMRLFGENLVAAPLCRWGLKAVKFVTAFVCNIPDGLVYVLRKTVYRDSAFIPHEHKRFAFAHGAGVLLDDLRARRGKAPRKGKSYAQLLTDAAATVAHTTRGIEGNFSFALVMAGIGVCAAIIYLLFIPK